MPHQYTKKRARDTAALARWAKLPDADFAKFGVSREVVYKAQQGLQGTVVMPGDPAYNTDRMIFNPVFNYYPAMIIYCVVESDVAIAINVSQGASNPPSVRSGGHCTAGFSSGAGVLIDVSALNSINIDPVGLTATVGCGVNFGNFRTALAAYGLHVPGGECDDVCIGGYMQGGGYGFTSVTFGMNCDNVIGIRMMLADGSIVEASESVNYDLWWAVRGGTGGTFGVLLSVTYQLRALGDCFGWAIAWPLNTEPDFENATGALLELQSNYMRTAPSANMNIHVSLCYQPGTSAPAMSSTPSTAESAPRVATGAGLPPPPQPMYPYLMVRGLWVGDAASGQAAIQALCNLPGAITQWTEEASFDQLNYDLLNKPYGMPDFPEGTPMPCEDKASRIVSRDLIYDEWYQLLKYYVTTPNPYSYFYMEFYGGAINAYPYEQSAFIHRDAVFNSVMDVFWSTPEEQGPAQSYLEGWMTFMEPLYNGHVYQNYPRLNDVNYAYKYWGDAQAGLYAVKCKYDPAMVFMFAQVVTPLMPPGFGPGPRILLPPVLEAALAQPIVYSSRRLVRAKSGC